MGIPAPQSTVLRADDLQAAMSGSGTMLPAAAYADPGVHAWEQSHFFEAGWVCLGRSDDLREPGRRTAVRIGSDGILLMRGADGVLRGFANACRHRGHELLPCGSSSQGSLLRCPYHSWVFDSTGALHFVPPSHQDDVTDRSGLGLTPVAVAEWHGFVFANASGDAGDVNSYFAGLDEVVAPYRLSELRVAETHEYEIQANWKLIVENYHECFHCPSIHPELCQVSDPDSGSLVVGSGLWLGGTMWLRDGMATMSMDGSSAGVTLPGLPAERARDIVYLHLFPNLLVSLHPDYVMTHRMVATAADRTWLQCQWLFPEEAWEREGFSPSYAADFWDVTNRQDWTACESVQRGVAGRGFAPGPFSSVHEYTVKSFVDMVARGYLAGSLPIPEPTAERIVRP